MSAGGKRPGSGRKPRSIPLVAINMRVEPEVSTAWESRKAALKISGPALLAKLLRVQSAKNRTLRRASNDRGINGG